jgi:hypothetical protein
VESPCRVTTENANFEIQFQTEEREGMQKFMSLNLKDLKTGAMEKFSLEEMNNLSSAEFFRLYEVSFRPGVKHDLAIHAYNSAREGESFYYLLYDSAQKKFRLANGTYPKLRFDKKSNAYVTEIQGHAYRLDKSLNFAPIQR